MKASRIAIAVLSAAFTIPIYSRADDRNDIKKGSSNEEQDTYNPYVQKYTLVKDLCKAADKLINHQVLSNIRNSSDDINKLADNVAEFIRLVELEVPKLQYDEAGWFGNDLIVCVDNNKASQFLCDQEAFFVLETLHYLQSKGFLENYDIHYEHTINHTAVGVSRRIGPRISDTLFILDPWMSPPGSKPKVFLGTASKTAYKVWWEEERSYTDRQKKEEKAFSETFRDDLDETSRQWWVRNCRDFSLDHRAFDFIFFKYFSVPSSKLRFAISERYFELMRDKIAYFLSIENKLTNKQKQELLSLSIRDKSKDEASKVWEVFDQYIKLYFQTVYDQTETINRD